MLEIKKNGTLDPLGIRFLRDSRMSLMAPARSWDEETDGVDGSVDFGSSFDADQWILRCVSPDGLSHAEKQVLRLDLMTKLEALRTPDLLVWETDPEKGVYVRLDGRPEILDHREMFEIEIPLRVDPFWISVDERSRAGTGTATNQGTVETPVMIQVLGPVTNPSVTVSGSALTYTGTLAGGDLLEIDTGKMTVKFNGVNALASYSGDFPKLQPGDNLVQAAAAGTTTFRWHDRWI